MRGSMGGSSGACNGRQGANCCLTVCWGPQAGSEKVRQVHGEEPAFTSVVDKEPKGFLKKFHCAAVKTLVFILHYLETPHFYKVVSLYDF